MYEKTFLPSYIIPVEDGTKRNITLLALISECGYLKSFTKEEIDNIKTIEVEWYYDGDDIEVHGFGVNGKTIREYNDLPENRGWSKRDDILVTSLLMWAELSIEE
tara:strand:- start:2507 stop:2821 length:315 start_codon:yes stop_codon:yes gene_type:complete